MQRKDFIAAYDYGQGGLWAVIRADTAEQVRQRYPQLQVFDERPAFVDDAMLARIREQCSCDLDGPPTGWLAELPP